MIYEYPKVQTPNAGTIFLMASTFDEKKYSSYKIKYFGYSDEVSSKIYSHDDIARMLEEKIAIRQRKQSFANFKEFIKIPLYAK